MSGQRRDWTFCQFDLIAVVEVVVLLLRQDDVANLGVILM